MLWHAHRIDSQNLKGKSLQGAAIVSHSPHLSVSPCRPVPDRCFFRNDSVSGLGTIDQTTSLRNSQVDWYCGRHKIGSDCQVSCIRYNAAPPPPSPDHSHQPLSFGPISPVPAPVQNLFIEQVEKGVDQMRPASPQEGQGSKASTSAVSIAFQGHRQSRSKDSQTHQGLLKHSAGYPASDGSCKKSELQGPTWIT